MTMARTECRTSAKLEHVLAGKSEPFTKDDVFLLFTLQDKVRQPSNHTLRQWSLTLCFVDRTERKPWLLVLCLSMLMASGEATSAAPLYCICSKSDHIGSLHSATILKSPTGYRTVHSIHTLRVPHLACSTPCTRKLHFCVPQTARIRCSLWRAQEASGCMPRNAMLRSLNQQIRELPQSSIQTVMLRA